MAFNEQKLVGEYMREMHDERTVPFLSEAEARNFHLACLRLNYDVVLRVGVDMVGLQARKIHPGARTLVAAYVQGPINGDNTWIGPWVALDAYNRPVQVQGFAVYSKDDEPGPPSLPSNGAIVET